MPDASERPLQRKFPRQLRVRRQLQSLKTSEEQQPPHSCDLQDIPRNTEHRRRKVESSSSVEARIAEAIGTTMLLRDLRKQLPQYRPRRRHLRSNANESIIDVVRRFHRRR